MRRAPDSPEWRRIAPRGGKVTYEFKVPVTTVYRRPWRRVLFHEGRDANPFFHLFEALWMLAGRDDARWLSQFSSQISQFAEDDGRFWGAYGRRWIHHFGFDQLEELVYTLQDCPGTRRAVLTMWCPRMDLEGLADGEGKLDHPCNTHVYFKLREGRLHMTVCCRSNDIIWGCYGANAVHFSILLEYMAARVGVNMGTYTHVSDSWHFYEDNPFAQKLIRGESWEESSRSYYSVEDGRVASMALVNSRDVNYWEADLRRFVEGEWREPTAYYDEFFRRVAYPMRDAWSNYKRGDLDTALTLCRDVAAPDWRMACTDWMQRRVDRRDSSVGSAK